MIWLPRRRRWVCVGSGDLKIMKHRQSHEREREREMGVDLEYIRAQVTIRVFIRVLGFDCVSLAI